MSQEEVNTKAEEELQLHTTLNENITIEVGHKNLSQLRAGDSIELEIPRENIPRNKFKIIQNEHLLTGNMKLQLGRYSKVLEDKFAELEIKAREVRSAIREKKFDESSTGFIGNTSVKIKPIKFIIRERSSSGGAVLGFGTHLNTNTRPLGHEEGQGVTHTILSEGEF